MFQLGLQKVASRYLSIQFFCKSDLYTVHLFFIVNTVLWDVVFDNQIFFVVMVQDKFSVIAKCNES